ncbi:TonB family protein [Marivita sp. S2033]|uniref:TonB family protein n=1 Tax=Marivita sp. S2033 TaxID=3373187 RepID=UPI003981CF91
MRVMEVAVFLTVSGALHVAALTLAPLTLGESGGGGTDGATDVTLSAVTPTLAAMVADWDRSPEVSTAPQLSIPQEQSAPQIPKPEVSPTPGSPVAALPQPESDAALPAMDSRLPAAPRQPTQTTLNALTEPKTPKVTRPKTSDRSSPAQFGAPAQPIAPPSADLPSVDTAPVASLRPEPRRARVAPTVPRPAQKARGNGGTPVAKSAPARQAPAASGPSKAEIAAAQAQWGAGIRAAIARAQRYPNGTRASGVAKLQITVSPSGQTSGVRLISSSGDSRLDRAAISAVTRARLPRAPKELKDASYRFNLPLSFTR